MSAKDAKSAAFGVWVVWRSSPSDGQGRQDTHTPRKASLASLASLLMYDPVHGAQDRP
jgi:hypothetical protein